MKQRAVIICTMTDAGDGIKRNPNVPITPDESAARALLRKGGPR